MKPEIQERINAAQAKRARKLKRYTDTPEARRRRADAEWMHHNWGTLITKPEPYDP